MSTGRAGARLAPVASPPPAYSARGPALPPGRGPCRRTRAPLYHAGRAPHACQQKARAAPRGGAGALALGASATCDTAPQRCPAPSATPRATGSAGASTSWPPPGRPLLARAAHMKSSSLSASWPRSGSSRCSNSTRYRISPPTPPKPLQKLWPSWELSEMNSSFVPKAL